MRLKYEPASEPESGGSPSISAENVNASRGIPCRQSCIRKRGGLRWGDLKSSGVISNFSPRPEIIHRSANDLRSGGEISDSVGGVMSGRDVQGSEFT